LCRCPQRAAPCSAAWGSAPDAGQVWRLARLAGHQQAVRQPERRPAARHDVRRGSRARPWREPGEGGRPQGGHLQRQRAGELRARPLCEQHRQPEPGQQHRGPPLGLAVRAVVPAELSWRRRGRAAGATSCRPGVHDHPVRQLVRQRGVRLVHAALGQPASRWSQSSPGGAGSAAAREAVRSAHTPVRRPQRRPSRAGPRQPAVARPFRRLVPAGRQGVRNRRGAVRHQRRQGRQGAADHLEGWRLASRQCQREPVLRHQWADHHCPCGSRVRHSAGELERLRRCRRHAAADARRQGRLGRLRARRRVATRAQHSQHRAGRRPGLRRAVRPRR